MQRNAQQNSNKPAIFFKDISLSWSELWQQVQALSDRIAPLLSTYHQDVVAVLMPNSAEFVITYLAILHTGHIAFPLDPAFKKLELDAIIKEIPPKLLITNSEYRGQITSAVKATTVEQLLKIKKKSNNIVRLPIDEQIASLTFTSGTTGNPKAVPNTHANHVWNIEVCSKVWRWTSKDTMLLSIPLSHWYGVAIGLAGVLYHANTLYLHDWFDERQTLEALSSGKISFFTHISQVYSRLLEDEGEYDLSGVRLCVSGGAPLPPKVWQKFKARFGIEILETYGSSETGRIAANNLGKPMLGSPGKILPGVEMKLGQDNEVLVKSPGLFPGYFNNQAASKGAYTKEGYFRTGDIAVMKDGYIFLKGRMSERIRRFGYTISPRDVEWAMHKHPQIKDIYVMGRQVEGEANDELIYFIVSNLTEQEIRDYCKVNLLFAWRPDRIVYLKSLPRTNSGKPRVAEFKKLVKSEV